MEKFWENMLYTCILSVFAFLMYIVFVSSTSDHRITFYYLGSASTQGGSNEQLMICGDAEWSSDVYIYLDRSITYNEAVKLVEDMNKKLAKRKY